MSTSTVLDPEEKSLRWSELGKGLTWVPTIVLNGASVTDGCRVLITNSEGLPAAPEDCRSAKPSPESGPISSSINPFPWATSRISYRIERLVEPERLWIRSIAGRTTRSLVPAGRNVMRSGASA